MKIRFILLLILLLLSSTVFAACGAKNSASTKTQQESQPLEEKSGFTTVSGSLIMNGATGQVQTASGPVAVESFAVDLKQYDGQTITVTGKYSGDTIFVSEVTPQ